MELCRLLSLADELLICIAQNLVNDKQSLAKLSQTCSHLRAIAEPFIYRDINIRNAGWAIKIATSINARKERADAVQFLDNRLAHHYAQTASSAEATNFNFLAKGFRNLRTWEVESPWTNYTRWSGVKGREWIERDMEQIVDVFWRASPLAEGFGLEKPLQLLQSLTLHPHGNGSRYYSLDKLGAIFLHPSLRTIHISCVFVPNESLQYLQNHRNTTPLTTLILDECEISAFNLLSILSTPKALTHLTLGENTRHHYSVPIRHRLGRDGKTLLAALVQQAHSLQYFKHFGQTPSPLEGLDRFPELRKIELATGVDISELSKDEKFLPPRLQELVLISEKPSWANQLQSVTKLRAAYWLGQLQSVSFIVVLDSYPAVSNQLWSHHRAHEVHKNAHELRAAGIRSRILARLDNTGAMPPFLYGETIPQPVVVYDSNNYSFEARLGEDVPLEERRDKDELTEQELKTLKVDTDRAVASFSNGSEPVELEEPGEDEDGNEWLQDEWQAHIPDQEGEVQPPVSPISFVSSTEDELV